MQCLPPFCPFAVLRQYASGDAINKDVQVLKSDIYIRLFEKDRCSTGPVVLFSAALKGHS